LATAASRGRYMPPMITLIRIIIFLSVAGCNLAGDSVNTILKEVPNQNKSKNAILFFKESGATVADSYQLTIADIDYKLKKSESGNALAVDDDHGATILDSSSIFLSWVDNDTLKVSYDKKLRTFIRKSKVEGINILYETR
jgi:hypothetical protein